MTDMAKLLPEPPRGTILLASDGRVWQRTTGGWNSTRHWFGWSWWDLLERYDLGRGLRFCVPGAEVVPPNFTAIPKETS